jgi:hypothetical protein
MSSIIAKIRGQEASERIKKVFINLKDGEFELTSPFDAKYNCIAHAAERSDVWWWSVGKALEAAVNLPISCQYEVFHICSLNKVRKLNNQLHYSRYNVSLS